MFSLFTITALLLFTSCSEEELSPDKIEIGNSFYYWVSTAESTPADAIAHINDFKKLEDKSTRNIQNIVGNKEAYVWIMADFDIPEKFRGESLGLVIPYLRFAAELWCNDSLIAIHGAFPPHEKSTLYMSHFFNFSSSILNYDSSNKILIKIYSHGQSAISAHSYIKPTRYAITESEIRNHKTSKIYMYFMGGLFMTFFLYLFLYINLRQKENKSFCFLNFFTMLFMLPFFAPEIPFYSNPDMSYMTFMKFTLSIPFFWMFYFTASFIIDFQHSDVPRFVNPIRLGITWFQTIVILLVPNYDALMSATKPMFLLSVIQLCSSIEVFLRNIADKSKRKIAIIQFFGFTPVLLGVVIDLIIRLLDNTQAYPFVTIFAWQFTIVAFLLILTIRYSNMHKRNIILSEHLQDEVEIRTAELKDANYELSLLNGKLEFDRVRFESDLEMASIVQKKFFPTPNALLEGWELSICYEPLAKVSGDMYDYYTFRNILNGISIFDVSGHGISASLITMLSKNIISKTFQESFREKKDLATMLLEINDSINKEKGSIDNYLTGILCRFSEFDKNDSCLVEMGNAGHPYPYLYKSSEKTLSQIKPAENQEHCGAIGMQGILVSFPVNTFRMSPDDIFVCFTDGLNESSNALHEQFGRQRIEEVIAENADKSAQEIMLSIRRALNNFTAEQPRDDDVTILVLKRTNSSLQQTEEPVLEELQIDETFQE